MSEKRRDNKNRILRNGESQRKDGRYCFKYYDNSGKQHFVYSWKLVATDRIPAGRRNCVSLREQEQEIQRNLDSGITTESKKAKITVSEYCYQYINSKTNIRESTRCTYITYHSILDKDEFGSKKVVDVTQKEAKDFCVRLKYEDKKYSTIRTLKTLLYSLFKKAIEDELILKNPFDFKINEVLQNDTKKRTALTEDEEKCFFEFVKNSKFSKYYDAFYVFFNTGLRVSELTGLTLSDIDFDKRTININHQLSYYEGSFHVTTTKTTNGNRIIPMDDNLYYCMERITLACKKRKNKQMIDDIPITNFLFKTTRNKPTNATIWEHRLKRICEAYNKTHDKKLPKITPHIARHTYCTKLIRQDVPIKIAQYLMGHSNAQVTLDVYSHVTYDDVIRELNLNK